MLRYKLYLNNNVSFMHIPFYLMWLNYKKKHKNTYIDYTNKQMGYIKNYNL